MANYDYGHDHLTGAFSSVHWSGIAGYVKYAPNANWALAARGEYFSDNGGYADRNATEIERIHLHPAADAGQQDLTRLEFRRDMSDQERSLTGLGCSRMRRTQ